MQAHLWPARECQNQTSVAARLAAAREGFQAKLQ